MKDKNLKIILQTELKQKTLNYKLGKFLNDLERNNGNSQNKVAILTQK